MEPTGLDLALMEFKHTEGAEQAYSRAPREVGGIAWAQEVAFVEHHGRDRIVVRGTFAGHYVDADDFEDFVGRRVTERVGSLRAWRASTPARSFAVNCSTKSAKRFLRDLRR
jgi:hypothetical protein